MTEHSKRKPVPNPARGPARDPVRVVSAWADLRAAIPPPPPSTRMNIPRYQKEFGVSRHTAQKELSALVALGKAKHVPNGGHSYYVIVEEGE